MKEILKKTILIITMIPLAMVCIYLTTMFVVVGFERLANSEPASNPYQEASNDEVGRDY